VIRLEPCCKHYLHCQKLKFWTWTKINVWAVLPWYYKRACQYCRETVSYGDWDIDHIRPTYLRGLNCLVNLIFTCRKCNRQKWRFALHPREERKALALAAQAAPEILRYLACGAPYVGRHGTSFKFKSGRRLSAPKLILVKD
jgi:hypothetical protein